MIVIRSKKLNIDTFWNCQRLFNTLCASSNTVLLTTLLPQIYYSDLIHKPIWIHLCSLAHGYKRALFLCKTGFVLFLVSSLSALIGTPHSTPNNSWASISFIYLINTSAICPQSPDCFDSMFSRLEFSKGVEKQRTKDWEGRWAPIVEQKNTVWADNLPPRRVCPLTLKIDSSSAVGSRASLADQQGMFKKCMPLTFRGCLYAAIAD